MIKNVWTRDLSANKLLKYEWNSDWKVKHLRQQEETFPKTVMLIKTITTTFAELLTFFTTADESHGSFALKNDDKILYHCWHQGTSNV